MISELPKLDSKSLRVVPFGGCGYFGMNVTAYVVNNDVFIVDTGSLFPSSYQSGIDSVIPNLAPAIASLGNLKAYIITHGHEDHIGAMPYLIKKNPAPIYAPPWAAGLLFKKMEEQACDLTHLRIVKANDKIDFNSLKVEWVHLNHSIPDSTGLLLSTASGLKVFHSGDFKIEFSPLFEPPANIGRLKALGDHGVDLVLADSTNANKTGLCPPEDLTFEPMKRVIGNATGATIITTFSSNLWRIAIIAKACKELNKKICLLGRGLVNSYELAQNLGIKLLDPALFIDQSKLGTFDRKDLVIIATGCQGERFAALARLANQHFKNFDVKPDDTIVFSSRTIPGNEVSTIKIMDKFERLGCKIITHIQEKNIHVSGHAYREDLSILCQSLKPKYFLPIHGNFFQQNQNKENYEEIFKTEIKYVPDSGDVFDLNSEGLNKVGRLEAEHLFVDGFSKVPLNYLELKKRLNIGELGLVTISGVFSEKNKKWMKKPVISFHGLALPEHLEVDNWSNKIFNSLEAELKEVSEAELSEKTRIYVRNQLSFTLNKKPIVIAHIHLA